jgi:hypothetical protein
MTIHVRAASYIMKVQKHSDHHIPITLSSIMVLYQFLTFSLLISFSYQNQYICDSTASCGCSHKPSILAKIIHGKAEARRDWPWVVRVFTTGVPTCGGSILSSSWILTAASCVIQLNISEISIIAGSNHSKRGTQQRKVTKIIMHPSFDSASYVNDIALIRLETPFDMTDPVAAKICLPAPAVETYPLENATVCTHKLRYLAALNTFSYI